MSYKPYANKKQEFDEKTFLYIAKRLFQDLDETDAAEEELIDGVGNILKEPNKTNDWSFTSLDRLLLMMRQQLGEKNLRGMLQHYEYVKDIDSLFIMTRPVDFDFGKLRNTLGLIITKIEDKSYLPDYLYHDEDEEYINEDDEYSFNDKARRALTIATYLLYGVRGDSTPSTSSFDLNVIPSIELTFGIRPLGTHDECVKFCEDHKLTEVNKVSGEGIRLLVTLSRLFVSGGLLINDSNRVENQTRNWTKLANERL